MKKIQLILLLILLTGFNVLSSFAQENNSAIQNIDNSDLKEYSYLFIIEIEGDLSGIQFDLEEKMGAYYVDMPRFSALFINSLLLEKLAIGLGGGITRGMFCQDLDFPCFVNFRYYFKKNKKQLRPIFNVGVGTIFNTVIAAGKLYIESPGIYFNCTSGFKYKFFQFHAGVNLRTEKNLNYPDNGQWFVPLRKGLCIDLAIKVGFNF
jgi:hypothetical protein